MAPALAIRLRRAAARHIHRLSCHRLCGTADLTARHVCREPMTTAAESEFLEQLERARVRHEERLATPQLTAVLDRLAAWQSRRLNATYADLAQEPRYAPAIEFFQTDLYGPGDFSRRDADLARVAPLMVRILPAGVIATASHAMELSTLSHELDRALLAQFPERAPLTVAIYCEAYRALANRAARERQIALIVTVGGALDRYVGKPVVRSALAAMR